MADDAKQSAPVLIVRWWWWVIGGAAYGVLLRVLFGNLFQGAGGPMSMAFLLGSPFVIGALTAYGRSRSSRLTLAEAIALPWLTIILMLLGCAVTLLEGSICLVIMSPLFFFLGSFGGLVMFAVLLAIPKPPSALPSLAVLPLLMLLFEAQVPRPERWIELRDAVEVDAPADVVWNQILVARDIRADELPSSLVHAIGVPRPMEGVNVVGEDGEVRTSRWERGIVFRAHVVERDAPHAIRWQYAFDAHSFPPGSMDDHVAIGGRYFDLHDTKFNLEPLPGNRTRLEIVARYRVQTPVNAYAVPVTKLLGRDFLATILGLYKGRSERAVRETDRPMDRI